MPALFVARIYSAQNEGCNHFTMMLFTMSLQNLGKSITASSVSGAWKVKWNPKPLIPHISF